MRGSCFGENNSLKSDLPTIQVNISAVDPRFPQGVGISADEACYQRMLKAGIPNVIWVEVDQQESLRPSRYRQLRHKLDANLRLHAGRTYSSGEVLDRIEKALVFSRENMPPQLSIGSGLVSVIGLSRIAKVVNIFGWDEYIEESIENQSYIGALWSLGGPSTRNIFKTFCSQILAWNYAVEMS